jgi:nitrous oxide reductase accessory protein NosL
MKTRSIMLCLALAPLLMLTGCSKTEDAGPPEIHFGQDTCQACGMIIQDERYAAAVVTVSAGGSVEKHAFDDIGEMLEFAPPQGAQQVRRYVREVTTRQWLDASRATLVKSTQVQTPMGSGIVAYGDAQAARVAAKAHGGTVITPESTTAASEEAATDRN